MRFGFCPWLLVAIVVGSVQPASAQNRTGLVGDLLKDLNEVEAKLMGLARAMPPDSYSWRPSKDVRSTAEVFMHVAADNYFMPAVLGTAAPTETGITKEYKTAAAFEKKTLARDALVAEVEKSFGFLKQALTATTDAKLDGPIDVFGQKTTARGLWIITVTHLHEHLGQLIAYARSNNVTPPWSK